MAETLSGSNPLSFIANILRDSLISSVTSGTFFYAGILLIVMLVFLGISLRIYKSIRSGI